MFAGVLPLPELLLKNTQISIFIKVSNKLSSVADSSFMYLFLVPLVY